MIASPYRLSEYNSDTDLQVDLPNKDVLHNADASQSKADQSPSPVNSNSSDGESQPKLKMDLSTLSFLKPHIINGEIY